MKLLSLRARFVVAAAVTGGLVALGLAVRDVVNRGVPDTRQMVFVAVFGALIIVSWLRPLLIYVGEQSQAIHLDEAFFVVLTLVVRPSLVVLSFAAASLVAQSIKRRPVVKSAFNCGQLIVSVAAGVSVFSFLNHHQGHLGYQSVGAVVVGALVFFVINNTAIVAVLRAAGEDWHAALFDGLGVRLLLDGGGVIVAVATALLVSADTWALPFAVLPLLLFREVLSGHFESQRDRDRVQGLFEAALEAHQLSREQDVSGAILRSARALLRCSEAELTEGPSENGGLSAKLPLPEGQVWLTVSGRSRTEPVSVSDRRLLEALAAVGAGAICVTRFRGE
jgi:hypothetical protein